MKILACEVCGGRRQLFAVPVRDRLRHFDAFTCAVRALFRGVKAAAPLALESPDPQPAAGPRAAHR